MAESLLKGIERAHLNALITTDGFAVLKSLMEDEVQKFHIKLINTDASDSKAIIAAHQMAKSASQFYVGLMNRINEEVAFHRGLSKNNEVQPDVTSNLDLGSDGVSELLNNIPEEEY